VAQLSFVAKIVRVVINCTHRLVTLSPKEQIP